MVATLPPKTESRPKGAGTGPGDDGFGRDPGGSPRERKLPESAYRLGLVLGLVSILMLFVALTSAYIVRQGLSNDWQPIPLPPMLWATTAMLLASSFTLEMARRSLKQKLDLVSNRWLTLTTILGFAFLVGQVAAWRQLRTAGVYMSTNPHSSFFYTLTGTHGLHLLGGVIALTILDFRFWIWDWTDRRRRESKIENPCLPTGRPKSKIELAVDLTAIYWHFMDALWIYLFILLFAWK